MYLNKQGFVRNFGHGVLFLKKHGPLSFGPQTDIWKCLFGSVFHVQLLCDSVSKFELQELCCCCSLN